MLNFKEWLIFTEAKKSKDIALELVNNDLNLFNQIKGIIPTSIQEKLQSQLLPVAAYYHKQQPNIITLKQDIEDYAELVKNQKMPLITFNDDLTVEKTYEKTYEKYLNWTQIIHGKKHENEISRKTITGSVEDQDLIAESPDGLIKVYKANSPQQCIILGRGQTFCISQPGNTMWQSYRDDQTSSFYFVYDNSRSDALSIVVIDVTKNGIVLTDKPNNTGTTLDPYTGQLTQDSQPYMRYLREKGIDISKIVNIPKSAEEQKEHKELGTVKKDLDWFIALSPDYKSKYIGRGHALTDEQFDFLWNGKLKLLLSQYVKIGKQLNDHQFDKIVGDKDLKSNYLHNRLIANQNTNDLNSKEYSLLDEKQKQSLYENADNDSKFMTAARVNDFSTVKKLVDQGITPNDNVIDYVSEYDFDILKYIIKNSNIKKIGYWPVFYALKSKNIKKIKYLLGDGEEKLPNDIEGGKINQSSIENAISSGDVNLLKYILTKLDRPMGDTHSYLSYGLDTENLEIIKTLIEKGANYNTWHLELAAAKVESSSGAEKENNIKILEYLQEIMDIKTGAKLLKSIEKGDFEYVRSFILDKTNKNLLMDAIILAAKKGKIEIFKYLLNKTENFKIIPNIDLVLKSKILQTGNISIVSILTKELTKNNLLNIGWNEIVNTAAGDNLETLIYIIKKASELSGPLFLNNLEKYYTAIIQNILLNRIKNVDILKYLLGETVNDKKGNQVKISVPIVPDYDHVSNTIVPQATYNLEIFKYLFEYSKTKGIEINWKLTIQSAVKNNDLKIVKYVTEKLIESGEKLPKNIFSFSENPEITDYLEKIMFPESPEITNYLKTLK
jgi:hypothetical protein